MNNKKLLYTLLLGATLTSCAEVEICERDHPHQGDVNFTYTWNKPEDKPNRMGVLCYRVVGQWKQVAEVNTDDLTLRLIGETTITPENRPNENPDEGDNTGGDNTLSVEMASRTYLNSRSVSVLLRLRFRPVVQVP